MLHSFDKYLETSISDNLSDIYDTKTKIDQLYGDYCKNYRYLDELIKMINTTFNDEILGNYISKEYIQNNNQENKNIIEEYSNN
jgi:predicted DNA-binding ArsR family transcriptional regulator